MISPVSTTTNPAPADSRTCLTVTRKCSGRPSRAGLSEREYWVLAMQTGRPPKPRAWSRSSSLAAAGSSSTPVSYTHLTLSLIKVAVGTGQRAEIIRAAELMGAKVADATRSTLTLEYADTAERTETLEALLRPYGIREIVRTGIIAIEKGADPTRKDKPKADAADPG